MTYELICNFAFVGSVLAAWLVAKQMLARAHRRDRQIVLGLLVGAGVAVVMAGAVRLPNGLLFDLRFALIASATLLEGPVVGLIAGAVAAIYRLSAGGPGGLAGTIAIAIALGTAMLGWRLTPRSGSTRNAVIHVLVVALAASALPHLALLMLPETARVALDDTFLSVEIGLNFIAVLVFWTAVRFFKTKMQETAMLWEALTQAPDFIYVKDTASRFVAANSKVISHHRLDKASEIVGKTDFDLSPDRAQVLFDEEQDLMAHGERTVHRRDSITFTSEGERIFDTIKTLVTDADGDPVGLVGITRDITQEWKAEQELAQSQELLSLVLSTMSDGVGLFDTESRLVFCNEQYHRYFPLTRDVRVPGAAFSTILRAAAERGEQLDIPPDDVEGWIANVASDLTQGGAQEIRLCDGRTIEVRTRIVEGRGSVSVVSDITQIRAAEQQLAALASRLQILATTDSLTAVMNRRAFDDELEREFAHSRRTGRPLSLLMIDVDHFKTFNDLYGHPEGDECLKKVASTLAATIKRASDTLARYGGEEFCVLLPETDAEGAFKIAQEMRQAIEARRIPHEGSRVGFLTISVGAATCSSDASIASCQDLKERADIALYQAKRTGRNKAQSFKATANTSAAG